MSQMPPIPHLRRDSQAMIDRKNEGSEAGERLLVQSDPLFHHWHRVRDGTLSRAGFPRLAGPIRQQVRRAPEAGVKSTILWTVDHFLKN